VNDALSAHFRAGLSVLPRPDTRLQTNTTGSSTGQLYAVEKRARRAGIHGEDLRLVRQETASPVIADLHAYLLKIKDELLPDVGQYRTHPCWIGFARLKRMPPRVSPRPGARKNAS